MSSKMPGYRKPKTTTNIAVQITHLILPLTYIKASSVTTIAAETTAHPVMMDATTVGSKTIIREHVTLMDRSSAVPATKWVIKQNTITRTLAMMLVPINQTFPVPNQM